MSAWTALLVPLGLVSSPIAPTADTTEVDASDVRTVAAVERAAPGSDGTLRPVRTNTPGTGVFIGSGLVVQAFYDRESGGGQELTTWRAVADYRYTPATHWVLGARLPWILDRTLGGDALGEVSSSGIGDLSLSAKHRFFRSVGRWSDRHMAAEVTVEVPTGGGIPDAAADLAADRRHRLSAGSGSVDFVADLVYQEGRRRFVYGGDLSFRLNTEGDGGYRFGDEVRLNLDFEYILFPLEYRRPGNEVFVLLETTLRRKWADEVRDRTLERTERTDLLLAPAVQHIVSDQLLASVSVQLPVVSDAPPGGLEQDLDVLAELRYAF